MTPSPVPTPELNDVQATALMVQWALKEKAQELNQALLSEDPSDIERRKTLRLQTQEFLQQLHALREQVEGRRMQALVQTQMQWEGEHAHLLVDQIEQLHTFSKKLTQALARSTVDAEHFTRLRQSAAWRKMVKAGASAGADGYFAPLLNFIANEASPALKAEWTARIELYIQSGWAARDCLSEEETHLTPKAKALRTLMQQLNAGALISNVRAMNVCSQRLEELLVGCQVKNVVDAQGELYPSARFTGAAVRMDATARSGGVDVIIPNAQDPKHLHVAVVTSDETTVIENTQLLRHHKALSDALLQKDSPYESMQLAFYVPCMLYEEHEEKGAGRALSGSLTESTQTPLSVVQRQALNVLPFISTLARIDRNHPYLDIGALSVYDLHLIGANTENWNVMSTSVRALPEALRKEALLAQSCAMVSVAIDALVDKALDGTLLSARGNSGKVLHALCESLEGIHHHAVAHPQLLETLTPHVNQLALFGVQITSDSAVRRRLSQIQDMHEYPGGVVAWAHAQLEREQRAQELLRQRQEPRIADVTGTAEMVQTQALVQHLSKEHDANRQLRTAIEQDTQKPMGFSRREASALQEVVRQGTLRQVAPLVVPEDPQRALDERLRRACAAGNVEQIDKALLDGAHLETRDIHGNSCAQIAAAHKAQRAQTHLEQLLSARCMDDLAKDVQHRQQLRRTVGRSTFAKGQG